MNHQRTTGLRNHLRRAFTLIEVMISALVLVLVFLSCLTALQMGFRMVDNARMANLADQTIQSQIESIRLLGWSYIGGTPPTGTWYFQSKGFATNLKTASDAGGGWITFNASEIKKIVGDKNSSQLARLSVFRMKVTDSVDPSGTTRSGVKRILVEAQWKGLKAGQTFTRQYETFISQ